MRQSLAAIAFGFGLLSVPLCQANAGKTNAGQQESANTSVTNEDVISRVEPEYPIEARETLTQGNGLFRLKIRRDGTVSDVTVAQTTTSEVLDNAAISALRRWRFSRILVPINFALHKGKPIRTTGSYPRKGEGEVLLDVDYETGKVTAGRMLESTGDAMLDNKMLQMLLKSRFKPRTVRRVRIPITFTLSR